MTRLIDLPAELLVNVFAHLPDFTNVLHLATTSTTTWRIWQDPGHARIIADAVMPRCIEGLPQAEMLLEAQPPSLCMPSGIHERVRRLCMNRQRLESAIRQWEQDVSPTVRYRRGSGQLVSTRLRATERARFAQAWYIIWTAVYQKDCSLAFNTVSLRSTHAVNEVMIWMLCNRGLSADLDQDVEQIRGRLDIILQTFEDVKAKKELRLLGQEIHSLLYIEETLNYAIYDRFQEELEFLPDEP